MEYEMRLTDDSEFNRQRSDGIRKHEFPFIHGHQLLSIPSSFSKAQCGVVSYQSKLTTESDVRLTE